MVTKKVLAEKVQEALEAKGIKLSVEKSIVAVNTVFNEIAKSVQVTKHASTVLERSRASTSQSVLEETLARVRLSQLQRIRM